MIKIVGIEFIPRLGNGRPENGTGTFVEALIVCGGRPIASGAISVLTRHSPSHNQLPADSVPQAARNKTNAICRTLARFAASTGKTLPLLLHIGLATYADRASKLADVRCAGYFFGSEPLKTSPSAWRYEKRGWLQTHLIANRRYILAADVAEFNRRLALNEFAGTTRSFDSSSKMS
jgi:hypothetical protein